MKNLFKENPVLSKLTISKTLLALLLTVVSLNNTLINSMEKAAPKTKEQWLKWADDEIHTAAENFLALYGLTPDNFCALKEDPVLVADSKDRYHTGIDAEIERCRAGAPDTTSAEDNAILQAIVDEVLIGTNCSSIVIVNDPEAKFDGLNLAIGRDYRINRCYIIMPKSNWLRRTRSREKILNYLRVALLHERSHILFHDTMNSQLLALLAFNKVILAGGLGGAGSEDELIERLQIERQELNHAQECRADIYAAIHAPDHGATHIEFLNLTKDPECLGHPAASERVKLLTTVKRDLDTLYGT